MRPSGKDGLYRGLATLWFIFYQPVRDIIPASHIVRGITAN